MALHIPRIVACLSVCVENIPQVLESQIEAVEEF